MASDKEPVGRIGAFSFVYNDQFYVCHGRRGYDEGRGNWDLPVQRYDFSSAQWSGMSPVCANHEPEEERYCRHSVHNGRGVCCAVLGNCAYTFGGFWKYGHAVHELNLETMVWRRLEPKNEEGPMSEAGAGMVSCGDEALCVFGGYGIDTGRHQPGATYHIQFLSTCVTNELHLFHIGTGIWSSPEITGPRPPPCTRFSFTRIDLSRAVLFGGKGINNQVLNEVHIFDMENWHWSGAILPSHSADLWPLGRHLHSACVLFDPTQSSASDGSSGEEPHSSSPDMSAGEHNPKLFVLWGSGRGTFLADAWILDVNSLTWKQVKLPPDVGKPRKRFSFGCHYRSPTEAELVVFGGSQERCIGPVADTTLFYQGMKTLYHSCVDYVAERYELYQPLLHRLLPPRIQTDICRERDKRASYRVAQL